LEFKMTEPMIVCPTCKTTIKLTDSLALPLIESTRKEYEQKIGQLKADIDGREAEVLKHRVSLAKERESIDAEIAERLNSERTRLTEDATKKARLLLGSELDQRNSEIADLQGALEDRDKKLSEAQKLQVELIRKQRDLDDAARQIDLTVETRIQESLGPIRVQARKDAESQLKLKLSEKEQTILSMQVQIEALRCKAEQGSQQLQGEVQELELEALLRAQFPRDTIEPVPKGEFGGDLLHRVFNSSGQLCGTIIWEAKRTKNWSDGWLSKLRDDQRAAKAEISVIVSAALPKDVTTFDLREDVWVSDPRFAVPVASVLRQSLIEVATARQASEGKGTKMELLYSYLTGPRFRQRIEAIVERFAEMQSDLERERKAITKTWSKREEQIRCMAGATAGMFGDLQGIAGRTLREVEGLELEAVTAVDRKLPLSNN
jgi:hypothetical protein